MPSTQLLLDDAIQTVKLHPEWSEKHLAKDLQDRHGLKADKARTLARRAQGSMRQETGKWLHSRRSRSLAGETSGGFDNIIRALEDTDSS